MLKSATAYICGLMFCVQFVAQSQAELVVKEPGNESFSPGEELYYKVSFGFFNVGKSVTRVDRSYHRLNNKICYKIDAYGETSDWISWITKVDDNWGAYLDTATVSTQVSYRRLREGRYRLDELTRFDHQQRKAEVSVRENPAAAYKVKKSFAIPPKATDLIGGFIHLRFIDFSKIKPGDSLSIAGFLEDKAYQLRILYKGRASVNTKLGNIPCHVLIPKMPDNKLFDGENSITVWISDDLNRIPVKIQARMFIGSTGIELEGFRRLKNPLKILR